VIVPETPRLVPDVGHKEPAIHTAVATQRQAAYTAATLEIRKFTWQTVRGS
jgi:hypothetical protein